MKIVFVGGRDIHKLGGIENYMYNLATQLVQMGHEPIVFCESDCNKEEVVNGFRVIYQRGPQNPLICKPFLGLKATLKVVFKMKGVYIIHYNTWAPSLANFIAKICGIRTLIQGHGFEWKRSKYSKKKQRILKFMENLTANTNKNLIMCSDEQTRYYQKEYGRLAVTIPTAINLPDESLPKQYNILEKFKITPSRYFLFLARLVQDKNPDYLIEAFNKSGINSYQLVIAGDNESDKDYVIKLHKMGNNNPNIIFTGAIYGNDKEALLQNAYAYCIPSTIEGLSISLLEAISYRLPIIASNIAANREVLEQDTAVWVNPENIDDLVKALKDAIDNPLNGRVIERNYKKVCDNYTWGNVAAKYVRYLQQL